MLQWLNVSPLDNKYKSILFQLVKLFLVSQEIQKMSPQEMNQILDRLYNSF